jgi:hypothetical protein
MAEHSVAELQKWLRSKAEGYFRLNPEVDPDWYRDLEFIPEEAVFLRAVVAGIIDIDEVGRCHLPGLNRATGNPTEPGKRPGSSGRFSKPTTARRTHVVKLEWREYLTQVIALAELILDYGWPREVVAFDPEARGAWTFDLAVFQEPDAAPPWVVAVETKSPVSAKELDVLSGQLRSWSDSGTAPDMEEDSKTAKAFRGLMRTRARYLWLRAPGRRNQAFALTYPDDGHISVREIEDIPRYMPTR